MGLSRNSKKRFWYVGIFFTVFFVFLYFQLIDDKLSYLRGADNASYILLAKSLVSGLGFSDLNIPGTPPHTQYPPFFPLMLSPFVYVFGYNFMWMRLMVIATGFASLFMIRRYFKEYLGEPLAYALAFLTGTSFFVFSLTREILPEIPYLCFTVLGLILLERYVKKARLTSYAYLIPLLAPLVYFTKFIGITLSLAVICVLLLRIRDETIERGSYIRKLGYFSIFGVLPFALWFIRNSLYARGVSSYQSIMFQADYYDAGKGSAGLLTILERAQGNISTYVTQIPMTFISYLDFRKFMPQYALKAVLIIILLLFLIGFIHDLFVKRGIKDFYTFFYLSILIVWPTYGTGDAIRYLVPIIPLLYYYFFIGCIVLIKQGVVLRRAHSVRFGSGGVVGLGSSGGFAVIIPLVIFMFFNLMQIRSNLFSYNAIRQVGRSTKDLISNLTRSVDEVQLSAVTTVYFAKYLPCYAQYLAGAELLKVASGPGDLIMTRKPEVVSLISGRYAVRFPYTSDKSALLTFMRKRNVTHILLDNCYGETRRYIFPLTQSRGDDFLAWLTEDGSHSGILKWQR